VATNDATRRHSYRRCHEQTHVSIPTTEVVTVKARILAPTIGALAVLVAALGLVTQPAVAAEGTTAAHSGRATCSPGRIGISVSMTTTQSVIGAPLKATGQHVATRAHLFRWDGRTWVHAASGAWLWSYASYGSTTSSWRSFSSGADASTTFTGQSGTYYAVAIQYYWYATSDVGSGHAYEWAQHTDMGGPTNGYCRL
jgi:hypothetical protein